jgi:hypothetical protein
VRVERNRGGERRSRKMNSRLSPCLWGGRHWRAGSRPVRKIMDLIECLKKVGRREGGVREKEREKERVREREKMKREGERDGAKNCPAVSLDLFGMGDIIMTVISLLGKLWI